MVHFGLRRHRKNIYAIKSMEVSLGKSQQAKKFPLFVETEAILTFLGTV
jgi:hypothetical protein